MKKISIPHIWALLAGLILLTGPIYLIYGVLSRLYIRCETISPNLYFEFGVLSTLGFWIIMLMINFVKIVIVTDDRLSLIFPFKFQRYNYKFSDLVKSSTNYNIGRLRDYETFHIQTKEGRFFMIMQYEYWNYKRIRDVIRQKTSNGEISRFHNVKPVFYGLIISILFTIGLILIFNKLIINAY